MIKKMLVVMKRMGCQVPRDAIKCRQCSETVSGGFSPEEGVVLCENYQINKTHTTETIRHEMIHAFDHCRGMVNWDNCLHHACSEVRGNSRLAVGGQAGRWGAVPKSQA